MRNNAANLWCSVPYCYGLCYHGMVLLLYANLWYRLLTACYAQSVHNAAMLCTL